MQKVNGSNFTSYLIMFSCFLAVLLLFFHHTFISVSDSEYDIQWMYSVTVIVNVFSDSVYLYNIYFHLHPLEHVS